jgi:hypothetical protein
MSTHAVRAVKSISDFSFNCLPWYYKKLIVFQINELRRRLEYLQHDYHYRATGQILPSSIPRNLCGSFQKRKDAYDVKRSLSDRRTSSTKDGQSTGSLLSFHPTEEKENRDIFEAVNKKRESILQVIKARRNLQQRSRVEGKYMWLQASTATSKSSTWYVRSPMNGTWTEPAYCSMEMISFDKDSECFHRTEIAYPFRPSVCNSSEIFVCICNNGKNSTITSRRLAKKLVIRTTTVNNIFKHSLIWD